MKLEQVLKAAVNSGVSDLILKTGALPKLRHNGELLPLQDSQEITEAIMEEWIQKILPQRLYDVLTKNGDADFSFQTKSGSRFRANVFRQRGAYGMVLRVIESRIRSLQELNLPEVVGTAASKKRGLVLVTGATGSGKSSTLAAIVQQINATQKKHIITVEDPIEFYYQDEHCTINQREIGEDAQSFAMALRASLRQSPDVILVGELRDRETTETALMAAETGHLVLSTLHTKDAIDTLTRLTSYFPPEQHTSLYNQLSKSLEMVISQRLVLRADKKGLILASEILVANTHVRELILNGNLGGIVDALKKGKQRYGMQSFDQSLYELFGQKMISQEQAINEASSRENMKLLISGVG